MLPEILGQEHNVETHYSAEEYSEAARRSGEGLRLGEEADARKQFQGRERGCRGRHEQADTRVYRCRCRGGSGSKTRQHCYHVEAEASGVYYDEVEARGATGSAADHEKWGSCKRADKTRGTSRTTQIAGGSTRRQHTRADDVDTRVHTRPDRLGVRASESK